MSNYDEFIQNGDLCPKQGTGGHASELRGLMQLNAKIDAAFLRLCPGEQELRDGNTKRLQRAKKAGPSSRG